MEVEHIIRSFPVDDNLQKEVQALEAQGWQIPPGFPPVMVYHLARMKAPETPPKAPELPPEIKHSLGRLAIDDSMIMVIPAKDLPK